MKTITSKQAKETLNKLNNSAESIKQILMNKAQSTIEELQILSVYHTMQAEGMRTAHEIDRQERLLTAQVALASQEMGKI